jgi:DNA repair protein RecO (recombination protein O)
MIEKTKGIVLTTVPYNDKMSFVHIYTERWGKQTYKVSLSKGKRSAVSRPMLAPLTELSLVADQNEKSEVQKIVEAEVVLSTYDITLSDVSKASQCFYIAELVDRTVREVENNPRLWDFLEQSVRLLSLTQVGQANFHLVFTARLSYLLGFRVDMESWKEGSYFDVEEGVFTPGPILHAYYLAPESAVWLWRLLKTDFSGLSMLNISREQRNVLLEMMLVYLRLHIPEIGELRSVEVLKEVFT